ncbi:hypothetical protein [Spiroplasma alleghenense]|uniref:Uncharacterized protein n=1 Tax=Spiroplasma alleghenense TaxID=216931 RepID=A0A345Z458_9MOLU|nr:hypothetical protein [Spiroplasma alleghenense]AXK51387.1 hypothetical protein SALLE_v1c07170 [Spiroplasma alleghenense]
MFKLIKIAGWVTLGMMLAPKKGVELRADFMKSLKKYRPQIKKLIITLEEVWEKSQGQESDEVVANIEMQLDSVRLASEELDLAKTKEIAYKALEKIGVGALKIGKSIAMSPNVIAITKDVAGMTVSAIDGATDIYEKSNGPLIEVSKKTHQPSDQQIEEKLNSSETKTSIRKIKTKKTVAE